jgi:hypothetical protein
MTEITRCRICKSNQLRHVLSLGEQALTGVFPKTVDEEVARGPLDLVWCQKCALLQLKQSYGAEDMYGDNYGYRSGLNRSMVDHLQQKTIMLSNLVKLRKLDTVLDIGSNDGTLLNAYDCDTVRFGMDPTAAKFGEHYEKGIVVNPNFFSAEKFEYMLATTHGATKPRIVTSIAMFYDLEDPAAFVRDVASVLADDGVWHFEQSYMPSMLRMCAYDAVCHEHLEFYSLGDISKLLRQAGLYIVDVSMNAVNGGSVAVTAAKISHANQERYGEHGNVVRNFLLEQEEQMGLDTIRPFLEFEDRVRRHSDQLACLVNDIAFNGWKVAAYGASTKGNVLLQRCGLDARLIDRVYEVNPDKFGRFTPGTKIPIVSEEQLMSDKPDYLLVLPWHFRAGIMDKLKSYRMAGGRIIFPLPEIEIL